MKNSRVIGNQTALCLQHEEFEIPDDKEIATISTPDQAALHRTMKNNIFGLSEDLRLKQLTSENQCLKKLVEDLMHDKLSQAHRIMELNEEKSRLKKTIADLILCNGYTKGSL